MVFKLPFEDGERGRHFRRLFIISLFDSKICARQKRKKRREIVTLLRTCGCGIHPPRSSSSLAVTQASQLRYLLTTFAILSLF